MARTKIPRRATRFAKSVREAKGPETTLRAVINRRLNAFNAQIRLTLFPALEVPSDVVRQDAQSNRIQGKLDALGVHLNEIFDDDDLVQAVETVAQRVAVHNGREAKRVIGIDPASDPSIAGSLRAFRQQHVQRIKSLAGRQLSEITQILERNAGARVGDLQKLIIQRFDVTKSRGALLARDQTLKLNAQITRTRMQNAGISQYIWTTSSDDRVRDFHGDLDGTRQRWDTPPQISEDGRTGHPGEDFQCRCTAFPVIPALEGTDPFIDNPKPQPVRKLPPPLPPRKVALAEPLPADPKLFEFPQPAALRFGRSRVAQGHHTEVTIKRAQKGWEATITTNYGQKKFIDAEGSDTFANIKVTANELAEKWDREIAIQGRQAFDK